MKFFLTCCSLLIIASCYKVEEKASSASISAPQYFLWGGSFPKNVYYSTSVVTQYQTDTEAMITQWNEVFKKPQKTFFQSNTTQPTSQSFSDQFSGISSINDGFNTVYLVDDEFWPTQSATALGVAILLGRMNKYDQYIIEEVDILIKTNRPQYDAQTIILHELGHFLGLKHLDLGYSRKSETVMYPAIAEGEEKHTPTEIDVNNLAKLYGIPSPYSAKIPRKREIAPGQGQLKRMMIELNADMNCRHILEGVEVHSHQVKL